MLTFTEYFQHGGRGNGEDRPEIHTCPELVDCIGELGFLPLLESGVGGFSAESLVAAECRYTVYPDGTWEWPLWSWKGPAITEGHCVYGKFFASKAGFVSLDWWPDLCNWRRSRYPVPEEGSIEEAILFTLRENDSMVARELRTACGFTGPKMRGRFDAYVSRLQMSCYIVTEDFVYPCDRHGREYGFGWSLLTTPERLLGRDACRCSRTPEESFRRMAEYLHRLLPHATDKQVERMIR